MYTVLPSPLQGGMQISWAVCIKSLSWHRIGQYHQLDYLHLLFKQQDLYMCLYWVFVWLLHPLTRSATLSHCCHDLSFTVASIQLMALVTVRTCVALHATHAVIVVSCASFLIWMPHLLKTCIFCVYLPMYIFLCDLYTKWAHNGDMGIKLDLLKIINTD